MARFELNAAASAPTEAFAPKRVGLHLNSEGQTEPHFANVHLGNLTFGSEEPRVGLCGLWFLAAVEPIWNRGPAASRCSDKRRKRRFYIWATSP